MDSDKSLLLCAIFLQDIFNHGSPQLPEQKKKLTLASLSTKQFIWTCNLKIRKIQWRLNRHFFVWATDKAHRDKAELSGAKKLIRYVEGQWGDYMQWTMLANVQEVCSEQWTRLTEWYRECKAKERTNRRMMGVCSNRDASKKENGGAKQQKEHRGMMEV